MARRKAKKSVKKSSPSPVREAKDGSANELKSEDQASLVSDEDGMLKFAVIPILFPEAGT